MNPVVSVILPTYNRANALRISSASVLAQTFSDLELIIVDDGSEEDIASVAESFKDARVRYIRCDENRGVASARNIGIAVAKGKYIAFQDSDDEWLISKLETQLSAIGNDAMLLCGVVRCFETRAHFYSPLVSHVQFGEAIPFSEVVRRRMIYPQGWLLPKYMLDEVGGFDEELRVCEDYELLLRLAMRFKVTGISDVVAISVRSLDSLTRNIELFKQAIFLIIAKHPDLEKVEPSLWARLNFSCARMLISSGDSKEARKYFWIAARSDIKSWPYWKALFASYIFPGALGRYYSQLSMEK